MSLHQDDSERRIPDAPKGVRQRDFVEGWRACEADMEGFWSALEKATDLAEQYGTAIERISEALPHINKVRLIIAGLDRGED